MITIELPENLSPDECTEIAKLVCYCDPTITACEYIAADNALEIMVTNITPSGTIVEKVNKLITKMSSKRRQIASKIIFERHRNQEHYYQRELKTLYQSGALVNIGIGVVSRSGVFYDLLLEFDRLLELIGTTIFGAVRKSYNILIPSEWLRKTDYFSTFPHSLTFAVHLKEDFDIIENFGTRHQERKAFSFESVEELTTPEYCMSPAVCYHCYGELQNHQFLHGDPNLKIFTAMQRCFRYESKNMRDLGRLWEFSMREIIFVGKKDDVLAARQKGMDIVRTMMEMLDLTARIETASDPFFVSDYENLRFLQLAKQLKYELCLPVSADQSIAAASFNYHEKFFGHTFNIRSDDNTWVHTSCVAFGLERFVYAAIVQLGIREFDKRLALLFDELLP